MIISKILLNMKRNHNYKYTILNKILLEKTLLTQRSRTFYYA